MNQENPMTDTTVPGASSEARIAAALDTETVADFMGGPLESGEITMLSRYLAAALRVAPPSSEGERLRAAAKALAVAQEVLDHCEDHDEDYIPDAYEARTRAVRDVVAALRSAGPGDTE